MSEGVDGAARYSDARKAGTKQERLCKEWQTFINAEMVEYHEKGSDFNFPKIHQLLHFGEQI